MRSYRQEEYQVIVELSGEFPIQLLCEKMGIPRSSFYNWKKSVENPSLLHYIVIDVTSFSACSVADVEETLDDISFFVGGEFVCCAAVRIVVEGAQACGACCQPLF